MKYYMSDVYNKKDLSSMDENYNIFMTAKNAYNKTKDNYSEYISEYMMICSNLKELLSIKFLTSDEFYYIREKIKKGCLQQMFV